MNVDERLGTMITPSLLAVVGVGAVLAGLFFVAIGVTESQAGDAIMIGVALLFASVVPLGLSALLARVRLLGREVESLRGMLNSVRD